MEKVVKIDLNNKTYGGRIYENEMIELLKDKVEFKREFMMKYKFKPFNMFHIIWLILKYKYFYNGTVLLTNHTTFFAGKKNRNIVVIHHIEDFLSNSLRDKYQAFCDNYVFSHLDYYDVVVTVAKVWCERLQSAGFRDVRVIYNSFDQADYKFTEKQISTFKKKYNLVGKPIIYLGNCQKKKGVVESYEALQHEDYHLVTSGSRQVDIPVINLDLAFSEYKLLLSASNVVLTMSKFTEGWNRTAHEASLCGTPVVGTGTGGMLELLTMANQTVSDFGHLKENVKSSIDKKYNPTQSLLALDYDYFKNEWLKVFGL